MQDSTRRAHLESAPLGQVIAATRRRLKQAAWSLLTPLGLTPQQYWILMVLMEHGPHSLHDLAKKVWIDDPTACRIVKNLAERGLVLSGPDPQHGRRILIQLSPSAQGLEAGLREVSTKLRGAVEKDLQSQEREQLRALLLKVLGGLDADVPASEPAPRARRAS